MAWFDASVSSAFVTKGTGATGAVLFLYKAVAENGFFN